MTTSSSIIKTPFKVGERPDTISHVFVDDAGAPLDLTGMSCAGVVLPPAAEDPIAMGACTIPEPLTGLVRAPWPADPFDEHGNGRLELWVGNDTNRRYASHTFYFHVLKAIAVPSV